MAMAGDQPVWALQGVAPKFATWSFGGGRPFGCDDGSCERWHAGVDLVGAPHKAIVVAPEAGVIVGVDRGWSGATKAVYLESGDLFIVLGGLIVKSPAEFSVTKGLEVRKGQKLGRVLGSYGMIHIETYTREPGRTGNSQWRKGKPPPDGLLNPTNYVERMAGKRPSLLRTVQRHSALAKLGFYDGDIAAPWGTKSTAALRAAQSALGVASDGKWGPTTEAAIVKAIDAATPESAPSTEQTPKGRRNPIGLGGWLAAGFGVFTIAGIAWALRRPSPQGQNANARRP